MRILTDTEACCGCRICELVCSFHHNGVFSPEASSIKISRNSQDGEIELFVDSTCDFCPGEAQSLCIKYCLYEALKEARKK